METCMEVNLLRPTSMEKIHGSKCTPPIFMETSMEIVVETSTEVDRKSETM